MKLVALALALSGVTLSAHHSIDSTYDLKQEVRLEGRIIQVLLRNPHSFLQVEYPDQDGKIKRWALEFPKGAKSLLKQGIHPGTLKVGDRVTITMNPSRKPGAAVGSLVTLRRASDGFEWSARMKQKPG
jgi:Family of unknown function (DUF6152)